MTRTATLRTLSSSGLAIAGGALGGALLAAAPAGAHPGHTGGVASGLLHPVTGPDHLLAMVAVGIVAATAADRRARWMAPAAFLGGMLLGGLAGIAGLPLPGAELMIVASVIVLGLVVAGALQGRGNLLIGGLVLAGLAHGHAHGAEAPTAAHPAAYVAGFLAATASLHLAGVGIGSVIRDRRTIRLGVGLATVTAGALLLV